MDLANLVRDVPDFPVEGVLFKDITTLLRRPDAFREAVDALAARFADKRIDQVVAIESRGFVFGAPLAYKLGAGFVPVRKPGKLPAKTISREYSLEYGTNTLEMHVDAIDPGQRVLLVDDLLATGGSARAAVDLVERLGGVVVGAAFLIELEFLQGAKKLEGYDVFSLIRF
ncbi:MAG TPA: adenine phosphoribosyltransferase [Chloroflexi bacterium]|jgi:adenine phosphoribosyltransferase|nr:adenine phosphoribosyltransferase [Chloroflexota bacterium]